MQSTTKHLRAYQVRLVTDVCRATEDVLVEQPTGSGKTVQIVTLVAMHLGQRFTHALISAPQEQIEQGFVARDYHSIASPECPGVAQPALAAPARLIRGARTSMLGFVKQLAAYLRQPGTLDYALACTHAALNQLTPAQLPDNLSDKALFIDEAHHASADGLSQLVALWRERGGRLFFFTATPYRGDGRPVRLDGMRAFRRSLAEHMAEGFAPQHLDSEIVALGQPGDAITPAQFTGEEAPPSSYWDGLIAALCRRWSEDGRPKTIIRVPPMQGGRSGDLVRRLLLAFESQGARVLDATGTGTADKQRFLDALEAERSRTYATSSFDVMVGIQRVLEGTDWPVCSAVYRVGMPGSLNTVVQFLGRAMRLKGTDYPAAQRDRARLVFFVPCGGAALAELSLDHSRHALLTCCFLADHEVGQEWIVLREVRRGIEAALGTRTQNPAAADAENEADEALDPAVRAEVELVMAAAREQLVRDGGAATVGAVVQLAAQTRPDLPAAALQRVAAEILAAQPTGDGAAVREAIQQEVARRLRIDPLVKEAMAAAFAVVLEEFREVTLNDSAVLESVGRQVHGVTGGQMRKFAERLRRAMPRPLTEEEILAWADAHHEREGSWPIEESGGVFDVSDETWANISAALQRGGRGLPGGSSLARLLAEHRDVRNPKALPELTEDQILVWADSYQECTGQWPKVDSGPIEDTIGEKWANVNAALVQGLRGLPLRSSLAQLLFDKRGVRTWASVADISESQIRQWVTGHFEKTGVYPQKQSGLIAGSDGETWSRIDTALKMGLRGLPGGSSLAQFLEQEFGVRNRLNLPDLTVEMIRGWVDAYHVAKGEFPTSLSGEIDGTNGETWATVHSALRVGYRGLPGGSSLARFLDEEFGVRNIQNPPQLTREQIKCWVQDHYSRTGKYPAADSGEIVGSSCETWQAINLAFWKGRRGLPGGSSLARFLEEEFGIQNRGNLPRLTKDQIRQWVTEWYEEKGKYPMRRDGEIPGSDGETWAAVNDNLASGSRGLPGGSTLPQFLEQEFGVRNRLNAPKLTIELIREAISAWKARTGNYPSRSSGMIPELDADAITWGIVDKGLRRGSRGLPSGSSLSKFIQEHFPSINAHNS